MDIYRSCTLENQEILTIAFPYASLRRETSTVLPFGIASEWNVSHQLTTSSSFIAFSINCCMEVRRKPWRHPRLFFAVVHLWVSWSSSLSRRFLSNREFNEFWRAYASHAIFIINIFPKKIYRKINKNQPLENRMSYSLENQQSKRKFAKKTSQS